jgi:hypothetical protein
LTCLLSALIDLMLISFWREKRQEQNLDKFLIQRESGVVRGALFE